MKSALIFEKDTEASDKTKQLLRWLGYVPVVTSSREQLLSAIAYTKFDVVALHSLDQGDDRRSIASEIKRIVPTITVILIVDAGARMPSKDDDREGCISIVLERPISLDLLRRRLEFGIDGHGTQKRYVGGSMNRRNTD